MKARNIFPWYLDGRDVRIKYMGKQLIGTVRWSRTKAGFKVQHCVKLSFPIVVGLGEPIECVLIEESDCEEYNDQLLEILQS